MSTPDFASRAAQTAVDALYHRTEMPAVLTDESFTVLASSVHPRTDENRVAAILARQTPAPSQAFVRGITGASDRSCIEVPKHPEIGMSLRRWCLPVHQRSGDYFFWLLEPGTGSHQDSLSAAVHLAQAMSDHAPPVMNGARRFGHELLECFSSDPSTAKLAMEVIGWDESHPAAVVIVAGTVSILDGIARRWERDPRLDFVKFSVERSQLVAILPEAGLSTLIQATEALSQTQEIVMGAARMTTRSTPTLDRAHFMSLVARLPESPNAMIWEKSGPWTALSHLPLRWETLDLLGPGIRTIIKEKPDLAHTALTYLDAPSIDTAIKTLHIHRNTLYYRLAQVSEYLGEGWDSGWSRTGFHQGLRLGQLIKVAAPEPGADRT